MSHIKTMNLNDGSTFPAIACGTVNIIGESPETRLQYEMGRFAGDGRDPYQAVD